jgi:hypothetical protein
MRTRWPRLFVPLLLGCALALSCGDDDSGGSSDAAVADAPIDAPPPVDAAPIDAAPPIDALANCHGDITWANAAGYVATAGSVVPNWTQKGYIDSDGDGAISAAEQVEVTFSMEDLHCAGVKSVVVILAAVG